MLMKWPMEQGKNALHTDVLFDKKWHVRNIFSLITFVALFSDREYPRLGQMIVDYENPMKKMMEEFVPHSKVCMNINNFFERI